MNRLPVAFFVAFILIIAFFGEGPSGALHSRHRIPASIGAGCFERMGFLLASQKPRGRVSLWRRLLSLPEEDFNYEDYLAFRRDLKELTGEDFVPANSSAEAIMAYIRESGARLGRQESFDPQKWSRFKRGQFEKVLRKLRKRGRLKKSSIEELTSELFLASYGPEFKWRHFFSRDLAQSRLVLRAAQEDIVRQGLLRTFSDYRLPTSFIGRFSQSLWGKSLLTGFFNLPVLSGFPPLYLPALKKRALSAPLARELLEEGLSEQVLIKLERELGVNLVDRARYEALRKSYVAAAMTFVTLAGLYDLYQLNKIVDEEAQGLEEATEEGEELLETAELLEEDNINIFEEESYQQGQSFCEAVAACVESLDDEEMCQDLMDPDSRCKSE